ncbi:hypothetical protein V8E55_008341 [Tylopilus felleus]
MDSEVSKLLSRAESLLAEFEQGGGTSYVQVDDPVTLAREVLEICLPPGDPKRPVAFTFLATHLVIRYERLGGIRDLDEVLVRVLSREARGFCPQGHPDHTMSLKCHGPAACLSAQYEQLRPTQDLDVPVAIVPGYPNHSTSLSNPVHLSTRHNQLGAMIDLEADLSTRYNQLGAMQDPEGPIVLDQEVPDLWLAGHPDRSVSLNNLADALSTQYKQLGVMIGPLPLPRKHLPLAKREPLTTHRH